MAVTTKMSVDVSGFKTGIQQAQNSVKTLDAELKKNEAQFKATGNSEQYMADKSRILQQKLTEQKKAVSDAEKALKAMTDGGLGPADAAYQQMERTLLNAQAAMYSTQDAMNQLNAGAVNAARGADQLANSVNSINKKVSLDSVIKGIGSITNALESAAKKAADLGKSIWDSIMDSARWADDAQTMAEMYEIPLDTFLRMQKLVDKGLDTSVDAMLGAQQKLKKGIGKESKETIDTLKQLGLVVTEAGGKTAESFNRMLYDDPEEMFWAAGKAIMGMKEAYEKETAAQAVFGKSWRELIPLFTEFGSKEEYSEALAKMNVNSEQAVEDLAALNDALNGLKSDFNTLKNEVLAGLAPALKDAADALSGLLQKIMDWLKTPEGQKALDDMRDAVSGLFKDLSNIDPQAVVDSFASVFKGIVDGLTWLVDHKNDVIDALKAIVIGWGAIKLVGGGLRIWELIVGLKGLGAGAAGAAGASGALGGIGAAGVAGGTSLGGLLAGLAVPAAAITIAGATVYLSGKIIADINDDANKQREVQADETRYTELGTGGQSLDGTEGGMDRRFALQLGVQKLQHETGGSNKVIPILREMATGLGADMVMEAFDYVNTSGQKRNKLTDMLQQNGSQNAAVAAMMLKVAGVDLSQIPHAAEAYKLFELMQAGGQTDFSEAYTTLSGFFDRSGKFVNGKFTIPGMENYKPTYSSTTPLQPWELSGYALTPEASKPTSMRNWKTGYWVNGEWREGSYKDVEINGGTWDPEAHKSLDGAAEAMSSASDVMKDLPSSVADAVKQVQLNVTLTPEAKANGMAYVPYDGFLASLHRGERIVPAHDNLGSRNYSSNLYVESMIMNNGTDAAGLAAAMSAAQRRTMSGYGS